MILDSWELQASYTTYTDELIRQISEDRVDVVIFLDKSARPVAWLVSMLWDVLAPRSGGQAVPPRPLLKFLNIDREHWQTVIGRSEDVGIMIERLPSERIEELGAVFSAPQGSAGRATLLDGRRVLVVDEVRVSGDTLEVAEKAISLAYPGLLRIQGAHWMPGRVVTDPRTGVRTNRNLPVWYSDSRVTGRLVDDRDPAKSARSGSRRQQTGRYWLSTRFEHPDQLGLQLRAEIRQLADAVEDHRIPYVPSPMWSDTLESLEARIQRLNGLTAGEYADIRRAHGVQEDFLRALAQQVALRLGSGAR